MSRIHIGERTLGMLKFRRFEKLSSWLERNLVLLKGKVKGKFKIRTAPHLRFIFENIDLAHVNMVVLKVASQTQKTSTGLGAILKWIDTDYHDMFLMLARATDIKKFLEFKVKPMLDGCKVVKNKLALYRQQESERKHSHYYITAQNIFAVISINDTKSITTKYGVFDEVAEFPKGVISEALERMKEYGSTFKAILLSTQISEDDEINNFFNITEAKFQYWLHCPHCDNHFYPLPEHLIIPTLKDYKQEFSIDEDANIQRTKILSDYMPWASRRAYLRCPICESKITNKERVDSILGNKCKWVQVEATEANESGETIYKESKNPKKYYESVGLDLNTMLAPRVDIKRFAQIEISCKYALPSERDTLYSKFYVGYWNKIYKPENSSKTKKSDILLLANGLGYRELTPEQHLETPNRNFIGIPHDDTNAIHIGVDLQKDGLYYAVLGFRMAEDMTVDIIEYGKLYHNGFKDDIRQLQIIMEHIFETHSGEKIGVTSTGIDIRGFKLKEDEKNGEPSRSQSILDFIFDYSVKMREYGVVNWNKIIHPMMGNKDLKGYDKELPARYEVTGYMVRPRKKVVEIDGVEEEVVLNDIVFSNKAIKDRLFKMIERGVKKAKASTTDKEYNYDRNLLYIPDYALDDFERRQSLPYKERMDKHSLENHLTSERLSYKLDKNGKPTNVLLYQKIYNGVRNDWLDCCCMAITQSLLHNTYKAYKPETKEVVVDIVSPMDRFKKSISG
jgi:DNA-directed RNA polymerase subunit RPC12/RpoP